MLHTCKNEIAKLRGFFITVTNVCTVVPYTRHQYLFISTLKVSFFHFFHFLPDNKPHAWTNFNVRR
jgi:hypothetical protein